MVDWEFKEKYDLADFIRIIDVLRSPGGCPWDIKQTHESLKHNVVEEAWEVVDAIDEGSAEASAARGAAARTSLPLM